MKRIRSVRGVELYQAEDGTHIVYIRYQAGGKQYLEKIGPSERVKGRDVTMAKGRRVLEQRRAEIVRARCFTPREAGKPIRLVIAVRDEISEERSIVGQFLQVGPTSG